MTETGLEARGVTLAYGRTRVVEGLDLAFPPGRFTALLGPNGCGKSTILRAFAGLHRPAAGHIRLDGRDIGALGTRALARRISSLAQGSATPEGLTVRDLVRQGRYPHRPLLGGWRPEDTAAVERALDLTGMEALAGRPLDQLSGGQRQRAWIAMTLAQQSPILLLDEPTTYLDPEHQIDILGLARRLVDTAGTTVVAVLHDLVQAARHADRLVLVKAGRIHAEGPPAEVLTTAAVRAVFNVEAAILRDPETGGPLCLPLRSAGGHDGRSL